MYVYMICLVLFIAFIFLNGVNVLSDYSDEYLSINTTQSVRSIAAIVIVMHHLSALVSLPGIFYVKGHCILSYIGFIMVALFFFLSGYGLMYGMERKEHYMDGFLHKKLLGILLPYWIVNTITILIKLSQGVYFSWKDYIFSYCGICTTTGLWFVSAILFCISHFLFHLE